MNLLFRLVRVLIAALLRPRIDLLESSELTLRVWPNDLDLNLHMNNGRYFTVMDLGRIDLMIRTGVGRWMWKQRWRPVVGSETMRFKRALKPFQRYRLKTRVLCWDERWVFLEQRFETEKGELAALGIVKAIVTAERRTMRPKEALKIMGLLRRSPAMPPAIKAWALAEEWMAEPRAPQPLDVEDGAEEQASESAPSPAATTVLEGSSRTLEAGVGAQAEPGAGRFTVWRRRSSSPVQGPAEAPLPVPEPAAAVLEEPVPPPAPAHPDPPPAGRFGQWRRRRA